MKLLHNILRGSTLATALFIFQACYGMPQNLDRGALYEATIKVTDSKGKPIPGVKLFARNADMVEFLRSSSRRPILRSTCVSKRRATPSRIRPSRTE